MRTNIVKTVLCDDCGFVIVEGSEEVIYASDRIARLEAALKVVHADLLMRGNVRVKGSRGVGGVAWIQLCEALAP